MPVTLLSTGESRDFEAPVPVRAPGGTVQECRVTFIEQPADFIEQLSPDGADAIDDAADINARIIDAIVRDWSHVCDTQGAALDHGEETVKWLLQRPYARNAVIDSYNAHINGTAAAEATERPPVILLSPDESRDFSARVRVRQPGDENDSEMTIIYRDCTTDILTQIARAGRRISRDLLDSILVSRSGVEDVSGQPINYSAAVLDMVLKRPYLSAPIINTYIRQISGRERDLGNSIPVHMGSCTWGRTCIATYTLSAAQELTKTGFEDRQAEAVVTTISKAMSETVATKADLKLFQQSVDSRFEKVHLRLDALENRLVLKLGGLMVTMTFLLLAGRLPVLFSLGDVPHGYIVNAGSNGDSGSWPPGSRMCIVRPDPTIPRISTSNCARATGNPWSSA